MTVATLAMSGTLDEARLLFIAVVNDVDKKLMLTLQVLLVFYPYQTLFWC